MTHRKQQNVLKILPQMAEMSTDVGYDLGATNSKP